MFQSLLARLRKGRASLWLRCCYFWYFAAIGCLGPYVILYYRSLQLNGLQTGVLAAMLPLGVALVAPVWGALADTYSAHRLVLRSVLVLAAITALTLAWVTSFAALLVLMLILAMSLAAIPAMLDGYALTISERENVSFGQLRVWGSVGFIVTVWPVAWLMGSTVSSVFLFVYAAALLLTCAATLGLPPLQVRSRQPMWQGVSTMIGDRSVVLLLLTVYLVMSNATFIGSYLSIYLSEIGGDVQLVAVASVVAALTELPVLVFGKQLLLRFGSRTILVLAVVMYCIRLALYSIPPSVSWVLAVQLLHGFSFGLYLMASVTLVHELAGRERAATAQGLLNSTSLGFGAITGSIIGGVLLDQIGAVGIFRVATGGMLVALGVCLFSLRAAATRVPAQPVLQVSREQR